MIYQDFDFVYWGLARNLMSANWVDYCSGDSVYFDSKAVPVDYVPDRMYMYT